ncbi:hypothetical protein M514_20509 [Trichuris suis]|uniref:Uncharacterized protein n=1 Tax=Trichuris suis TaxID=68888 RepID=A0A085NCR4_9BILA|nr:hypothetical protein M514_20509 [Trichuris suis]KHJ47124.1 hypothetical protein D918_02685 [Trichuris suis]
MTLVQSVYPRESAAYLAPFLWLGGFIFITLLSMTCCRWRRSACCKKKEDSELRVELEVQSPASPGPATPVANKPTPAISPESPSPVDKRMREIVKPKQGWYDPKGGNAKADSEMETMRKIPSIAEVKQDDKKLAKVKSGAKDYETMVNIGSDIWNPK